MASVVRYFAFRHAHALPAVTQNYTGDLMRSISAKGHQEIEARRKVLHQFTNIDGFDQVLAGTADRLQVTVKGLSGLGKNRIKILPELGYPNPSTFIGEICDYMYQAYGDAPYGTYRKDPSGHLITKAGLIAARAVKRECDKLGDDLLHVLTGNHGVYLNAMMVGLGGGEEQMPKFFLEQLFDTAFKPCEGCMLEVCDGKANSFRLFVG